MSLSFENINEFRQEYTFGDITNDAFGDELSYCNNSLKDAGEYATKLEMFRKMFRISAT